MRMLSLLAAGLLLVACAPEAEETAASEAEASTDLAHVTNAPPVPRDVADDAPTAEELALSAIATAPTYEEPFLLIDDAWAPPPPAGTSQAAIYLTIANTGGPDLLTAAATPIAGHAMLHGHVMDGDVARMEERSEVEIPAGGGVTFEPGGDHIMLMGLSAPLTEGERFPLTLTFERAGSVDITVEVESLASRLAAQGGQDHR